MVGGLEGLTRGDVHVDGKQSVGPSRDKTMVFQHFNLFPWRSALANVAYGLEIQGMPKQQRLEKARRYLDLVGLSGHADHFPGELSGGMQQRVGIARALAVEPKLLLMDEPFGALDALTREHLQTELLKICAEANVTVLFVTHSIDEAIYLSDHVIVMGTGPGRIVAEFDVRAEPTFLDLREQLWNELERELRGTAGTLQGMSE
jgi:NitT/TauT family transport system ATP-binding protein